MASVASFFVSRIDTEVDKLLDEKIARVNDPDEKARLTALKGKMAVANAKLAYQRYLRLFTGERWHALAEHGAKPQRLLWASTGTKNKAYSDVLYIEELIGADTVSTMPLATIEAFRDHGKVRDTLEADVAEAQHLLGELGRAGVFTASGYREAHPRRRSAFLRCSRQAPQRGCEEENRNPWRKNRPAEIRSRSATQKARRRDS